MAKPNLHIVLLGDSIFDNARYVPGELSVSEQLAELVGHAGKVSLLAIDGSTTNELDLQIGHIPSDATHLVLSIGGNDAMQALDILFEPAATVSDALFKLHAIRQAFRQRWCAGVWELVASGLPLIVCTIYNSVPNLPPDQQTALALFNEVILEEAGRLGLPVIDLRLVCNDAGDYSAMSPIEPSFAGGMKIAQAIHRIIN